MRSIRLSNSVRLCGIPMVATLVFLATFQAHSAIPSKIDYSIDYSLSEKAQFQDEIKVRLDTALTGVTLSGIGLRLSGIPTRQTDVYQAVRLKWSKAGNGYFNWTVEDRDKGTVLAKIKALGFSVIGSNLRLGLKPVPNRLLFKPSSDGRRAEVIAAMDLERYLEGVLPGEIPKDWPLEALKAQAIASRTYALNRKRARENTGASYHVDSTVNDQVYLVPVMSEVEDASKQKIKEAVTATRGLVLTSKQNPKLPITAHFHSDCGGHTEDARDVWKDGQSLGSTACPFNATHGWRAKLSVIDLEKKIRPWLKRAWPGEVESVEISGRTASGRVRDVRIAFNDGSEVALAAPDFRTLIGHDLLKSTNFRVTSVGEGFEFSGTGFGHGVGMCQWGARKLALGGKNYRDILAFYYPKAVLSEIH